MVKPSRSSSQRRARKRSRKHRGQEFGILSSERDDGPTDHTLDRRAEKLIETIIRYPDLAVQSIGRDLAKQQYAGTIFGRLYMLGAIDWQTRLAADKFVTTLKQYRQGLSKYSTVRISNYENTGTGGSSSPSEDLSDAALKRFKKIQKKYDHLRGILKECGADVEKAVMDAADDEILGDLVLIKRGLVAISRG